MSYTANTKLLYIFLVACFHLPQIIQSLSFSETLWLKSIRCFKVNIEFVNENGSVS